MRIKPPNHGKAVSKLGGYAVERTNVWASVKNLYQQIVPFNLSQRPSASQLASIIAPDTKEIAFEHNLNNQNGEKQGHP